MVDLSQYQWKNRLLMVFAPAPTSAEYGQQMELLEGQQPGFDERELLLIEVVGSGDDERLRDRFAVPPSEFRVILVGKDGTAKRQDARPVEPEAIFAEIDAMPMRQREMQERSS